MKTPEELAKEHTPIFENIMKQYTSQWEGCPYLLGSTKGITAVSLAHCTGYECGFLAGYSAGQEATLTIQSRMDNAIDRMFQRATANFPKKLDDWISVEERNPDEGEIVLVAHKNYGVQMGYIDSNRPCRNQWAVWIRGSREHCLNNIPETGKYKYVDVTHWMPLPKPPEGE